MTKPQPPRMAAWLVALFTRPESAESIAGDLVEEFSGLVSKAGVAYARAWYWRQVVKTLWHAGWNAFRVAPLLMIVAVVGGWWLTGFGTRSSAHAMQAFLDSHRIYDLHPDAYLFWIKFPFEMGRVVLCVAIGAMVGLVARKMEMVAAVTLASVQILLFLVAAVALIASGRAWLDWFLTPWNLLSAMAVVAGGTIVRTWRTRTI
jgi:hypothetical protein